MERVLIGFGSNQGDSARICREAVSIFGAHPEVRMGKVSSLYRTKPVGPVNQAWFINGVFECETSLAVQQIFEITTGIEQRFGRVRTERWGPRTLDLDILFYGSHVIHLPNLTVPHPRIQERLFVLFPLAEIIPEFTHPLMNMTVKEILDRFLSTDHDQEVERVDSL